MRGLLFAVLAEGALVLVVGCANVDRGLGDPCIRNEDCLSGVCAGQQCVASPPLFDATPVDAGVDSASDALADAPPEVAPPPVDTGSPPHDSGTPVDTGTAHDAADASKAHDASVHDGSSHDGALHDSTTHDAGNSGTKDAGKSKDALADGLGDAHHESG